MADFDQDAGSYEMREMDAEFRKVSGLSERRYYKLFYSHIHSFPLLVLGQNPGGETDGTDLVASEEFFENWQHDFVCFRSDPRYAMAGPMFRLLSATLQTTNVNQLRQVPVSNVIFRRSRNTKSLNLSPTKAAQESAPVLRAMLRTVNPSVVLLTSGTAYKLFAKHHCDPGSVRESAAQKVYTPNGKADACMFLSAQARVLGLNRTVQLFVIGHPSKYAARAEWPQVVSALRQGLQQCGVSPIEPSAFVALNTIPSYGSTL